VGDRQRGALRSCSRVPRPESGEGRPLPVRGRLAVDEDPAASRCPIPLDERTFDG
jgi:hypothetical protein